MTTKGEAGLPRYVAAVHAIASRLAEGTLDFVLPDGRRFRCGGRQPGEMAEVRVLNPDLFARMVREGELGFCEAYLDGGWDTPDLQALIDLVRSELEQNRPCVIYIRQTATRDIQPRIEALIRQHVPTARTFILKNTVEAERREAWIEAEVAKGTNIVISNL